MGQIQGLLAVTLATGGLGFSGCADESGEPIAGVTADGFGTDSSPERAVSSSTAAAADGAVKAVAEDGGAVTQASGDRFLAPTEPNAAALGGTTIPLGVGCAAPGTVTVATPKTAPPSLGTRFNSWPLMKMAEGIGALGLFALGLIGWRRGWWSGLFRLVLMPFSRPAAPAGPAAPPGTTAPRGPGQP